MASNDPYVLLADLPREDIERRYGILDGSATAANAGIDFPKLYRDVDQTRRTGIGMNFEESEDSVAALGVSLGVVDGQHAALRIAMPMTRFARQDAKRLLRSYWKRPLSSGSRSWRA